MLHYLMQGVFHLSPANEICCLRKNLSVTHTCLRGIVAAIYFHPVSVNVFKCWLFAVFMIIALIRLCKLSLYKAHNRILETREGIHSAH